MRNLFQQVFRKSSAALLIVALASVLAVGCGDSENFVFTNNNFILEVREVLLTPDNATLTLGQSTNYALTLIFNDDSQTQIDDATFTSDDPSVVTIDPNTGVATAVMVGTTTITATNGSFSDSTTVTVTAAAVDNNPALSLVVSNADTDDLDIFSSAVDFIITATFDSSPAADTRDQGILLDVLRTAFHNGGDNVAIISRLFSRDGSPAFQTTSFDSDLDREVDLSGVANVAAKGSVLIADEGLLVVANFSGSGTPTPSLIVFGTGGTTFTELTTGANRPWDAAYDDATDTLYVAFTNGTIGVYDDFAAEFVAGTATGVADRTISPNGLDNSHGIVITGNTLIVSDVGPLTSNADAGFDTDGEIYIIPNASTANGALDASVVISGSNTLLGNPVDIDLQNGDLRVAEKANGGGQILVFTSILTSPGGNIAPTVAEAYAVPEALTSFPQQESTAGAASGLVVSSNPAAAVPGNRLFLVDLGLTTATSGFVESTNMSESAVVDGQGDVFVSGDAAVGQFGRAGTSVRNGDVFDTVRDRNVATGLTTLKGLDVWDDGGLLFIADNDDDEILILGKNGDGTDVTAPLATNDRPWDVFYDATGDDLYVANQDGTIEIWDGLVAGGFSVNPTRTITITGGGGGGGLHGIVFDNANDRLFVSDVNTVGTDDGVIFVITGVNAITDGTTLDPAVAANVTTIGVVAGGGANSELETPVDIAYDGTFLYVADKTAGLVRRYNVSGVLPSGDVADGGNVGVAAAESVSVFRPRQ